MSTALRPQSPRSAARLKRGSNGATKTCALCDLLSVVSSTVAKKAAAMAGAAFEKSADKVVQPTASAARLVCVARRSAIAGTTVEAEQALAGCLQPVECARRVVENSRDVRIDSRRAPIALDEHRHAQTGAGCARILADDEARVHAQLQCLCRDVDA